MLPLFLSGDSLGIERTLYHRTTQHKPVLSPSTNGRRPTLTFIRGASGERDGLPNTHFPFHLRIVLCQGVCGTRASSYNSTAAELHCGAGVTI